MAFFGKKDSAAPIIQAAKKGETQQVRTLVNQGADVNAKDEEKGWTALIYAVENAHAETAQALLDVKADVNAIGKVGTTPLMLAALTGNMNLVKALLAAGAIPAAKDAEGRTALDLVRVKVKAQGMYADDNLVAMDQMLAALPAK